MKNKIIVANWKMNNAFEEADEWLQVFAQRIHGCVQAWLHSSG